jgi:hypothetical protein
LIAWLALLGRSSLVYIGFQVAAVVLLAVLLVEHSIMQRAENLDFTGKVFSASRVLASLRWSTGAPGSSYSLTQPRCCLPVSLLLRRILYRAPDHRERDHWATLSPVQKRQRHDHCRSDPGDSKRGGGRSTMAVLWGNRHNLPRHRIARRTFYPVRCRKNTCSDPNRSVPEIRDQSHISPFRHFPSTLKTAES